MITITTMDKEETTWPTMGIKKGKVVVEISNILPWRIIEITPDELEFKVAVIEHKEGLSTATAEDGEVIFSAETDSELEPLISTGRVKAILAYHPEYDDIYQEVADIGFLPKDIIKILKENGKTEYAGNILYDRLVSVEEFKEDVMTD